MESNGLPGRIHVSNSVFEHLQMKKDAADFSWECRGDIPIKGKGIMTTYFVERGLAS